VSASAVALDAAAARRIAGAFLPARWHGNRYDYYYTLGKLRTDPLYPGVLDALRGCDAPLLDLGCGLGLLAHALHHDGQRMAYTGADMDAGKLARARAAAARAGLGDARFELADLGQDQPAHRGSVALLDVLHYLPETAQAGVVARAAAAVAPGARLVIRSGLGDASGRDHVTRAADWFGHLSGWMRTNPRHYPARSFLEDALMRAGLRGDFRPLYGNTPFNNWLIVATRSP
jgi:SAM-dependent methyltransferase